MNGRERTPDDRSGSRDRTGGDGAPATGVDPHPDGHVVRPDGGEVTDEESTVAPEAGGEPSPGDAHGDEFDGTATAILGLVAAGIALAAAIPEWAGESTVVPALGSIGSPLAAILAAVAFLAFASGRRASVRDALGLDERTARRATAGLAGVSGAGIVLLALYRLLAPAVGDADPPPVGPGLPVAATAGVLCVGFAIAQARDASGEDLARMARYTGVALAVPLLGFLLVNVVAPLLGVHRMDQVDQLVVGKIVTDVVFIAVGIGFLVRTGRGLEYVDLELPDVRDLAYVGAGLAGLFGLWVGISIAIQALGLPAAEASIAEPAREGNPEILLIMIPLSFLLVGPAEELVYRNVVQKYLYGAFSRPGAVVVASGIFAAAHLFTYLDQNAVATLVSLSIVFGLSLVLGGIYERTENLVVPAFVHGAYNAALFALLYVSIVYGEELATYGEELAIVITF